MTEAGDLCTPMAVVDAGDEPWERLARTLTACLSQLPAGGVLEVLLRQRATALRAARWCRAEGHTLVEYRVLPTGRHLRVRKEVPRQRGN